ncbi:MAG: carboxypeptidase regulatory-like domain-containing protein [Planctomycetota bacterium]|nr:carboxypeptidase regulatory-like domain-containing protein [Planctomycetota bacterium]MDA1221394.1 carboxypeptidase regulatory-like domain-containing protein [Planctomycetota bacterium]
MTRPSHWILGFLFVVGGGLWTSGALESSLAGDGQTDGGREGASVGSQENRAAPPAGDVRGRSGPVVVRRAGSIPPPVNQSAEGRVVDRLGFPVAQARVRVTSLAGDSVEDVPGAVTDGRGRFQLTWPGIDPRALVVEAPGRHAPAIVRASADEMQIVLQDPTPWSAGALAAVPGDALSDGLLVGEGWVRGSTGPSAAGVQVTVRETGASTRTDETGRFTLPLGSGPCTLVAFDGLGAVATAETFTPSRRQGKIPLPQLELAAGPALRGRLINTEGEPLVDAAVVLETGGVARTVRSGQGGMFAVLGLVQGECELSVLPHRGHLGMRIPLVVEADADLSDLVLERPRQEPHRIHVVDRRGRPLPFFHVVADQLTGLCRAYAQADADGIAILRGLSDGDVDFEVRRPDFAPVGIESFDEGSMRLVVAPD